MKARGIEADAEVGAKLTIALVVESKKNNKKRGPPKKGKNKALLSNEDFLSLGCVLSIEGPC